MPVYSDNKWLQSIAGAFGISTPATNLVVSASGTITTQNLAPTGVATAGSAVELASVGFNSVGIQVTGTYTGALTPQGTVDGTTWVTIGGLPLQNVNTGAVSATIASATQGIFLLDVTGYSKVRISGLAAMTGTATVTLRGTGATSLVSIDAALPTGTNSIGTVVLGTTTTAVGKVEDAAHATGDGGIPDWGVRYEALTAPASAANDYTLKAHDDLGKYVTMPYAPPINHSQGITTAMTGTADTAVIAAPGASIRLYITDVTVVNAHATVGTEVLLKDGATTLTRFYVPALSTVNKNFSIPLKLTANTAFNAANVTTGSSTYVQATGFRHL